jgi:hypothetical protein
VVDLPSRILQNPRVGLGVTTAALVALATGGTSLLVSHGTRQLQPVPPVAAAPQASPLAHAPVVVDRAPGSIALPPAHPAAVRPVASRPASDVPVARPDVPVAPPVEQPPSVTVPPVTEPPVTEPPVTEPPVTEPPVLEPDISPGHGRHPHPDHPQDRGKHLGQLKH